MADTPLVAVRGLRKRYGGVVAVDGMNLAVRRGAIHAVVGENGAGKSTLMKVLAGVVRPDAGEIEIDGRPAKIVSPVVARQHGVGIVYQELSLFPQRSVLANLFVNREPLRRGFVSVRAMEDLSRDLLDRLGLRVDVHTPVSRLSIGEQQLVELARVLLEEPRLLILDEPNSALTEQETKRLFDVLRQLNGRGITMLYVSHRLEEVFAICDWVTVTRNGRDVMTRERANVTMREVIEGMIGAPQTELFPPPLPRPGGRRIVDDCGQGTERRHVEGYRLHRSLGRSRRFRRTRRFGRGDAARACCSGHSVHEAARSPFRIALACRVVPPKRHRRGIALVPADRRRNGLMLDKSVLFNISHVAVGALKNGLPWFDHGTALDRAVRQIDRLRIKTRSPHALVSHLSGGNQQKTVLGKWLEVAPRVILLDDPTRGVDVGAKREIYGLIRRMSADGRIILFSSTELPELIGLCDRIIVLYRGRIVGEIKGGGINERTLLHAVNTGEIPQVSLQ